MRIGLHSGVTRSDIERNQTSGRAVCTGVPLALAKAIGDAGQGGMVLLSQACFERLQLVPLKLKQSRPLILCMGEHKLKDEVLPPAMLYQVRVAISSEGAPPAVLCLVIVAISSEGGVPLTNTSLGDRSSMEVTIRLSRSQLPSFLCRL